MKARPSPSWSGRDAPPRVTQALVGAASRLSHPDDFANPKQLLRIDGLPIITHLLKGLQSVGIERVVITLGHAATTLADAVRQEDFGEMQVDFVWCEDSWKRGHATNIMAARSMFEPHQPILIVMSDQLYDWRLLSRLAQSAPLADSDAVALVDDRDDIVQWVTVDHCRQFCKNGHCHSLIKILRGRDGRVAEIGKKLERFDALEAGAYTATPVVFDTLAQLLHESSYCTLADAMRRFAHRGRLRYLSTEGQRWFSSLVVVSAALGDKAPKLPDLIRPEWVSDAQSLLMETSPKLAPSRPGTSTPIYRLGAAIGEGFSSVVVEGMSSADSSGHLPSARSGERLNEASQKPPGMPVAVKVVPKGSEAGSETSIMREVHMLKLLSHEHIVRVMDVIDVVDATYIVMQRVDGPELTDFIEMQPMRRVPPTAARVFFCHVLSALRHAHSRGLIHCDVKPQNVRLNAACDRAVLTDWGLARGVGTVSQPVTCGTPLYASPEQLTGYDCDSVCGRAATLSAAVDVWALGATLCAMLAGEPPFCGRSFDDLVHNVLALRYAPPPGAPAEVRRLLHSMLQRSALDRASLEELAASPWVQASGLLTPQGDTLQRSASGAALVRPQFECLECAAAECDESAKPARPPAQRKLLARLAMLLVYAALCAAGAWVHLQERGSRLRPG